MPLHARGDGRSVGCGSPGSGYRIPNSLTAGRDGHPPLPAVVVWLRSDEETKQFPAHTAATR